MKYLKKQLIFGLAILFCTIGYTNIKGMSNQERIKENELINHKNAVEIKKSIEIMHKNKNEFFRK